MKRPDRLVLPDEVVEIAATLERAGFEAWCVGGAIRDAHLGSPCDDVDLATSAKPEDVQRLFKRTVPVGIKFGTVGILDRRQQLHEVTTFRRDVSTDGRHAIVEYGAALDDDLARRDFTINAIAYHPIRHEWRDPFGGAADLERRVVRAVGEPTDRFREDYLRILRAIRFAARLGFTIEPSTWAAAKALSAGLDRLSAERVRDEWFRSLETALSLGRLVELWHEAGVAAVWLPRLTPRYRLARDPVSPRDPVLLTVALVDQAAGALRRLKASSAEIERAERIETAPDAPHGESESAVRRWLAAVEPAADDILRLTEWRTGQAAACATTVGAIRARRDPISRGELAIDGTDLIAAGISPGPKLGQVLDRLLDAVLDDPTLNHRDTLLAMARRVS